MSNTTALRIEGQTIRQDKETMYFNISDLAAAAGRDTMEIPNWLRGLSTVEFIEEWEKKHNPDFNYVEFDIIKRGAGGNSYRLSVGTLEEVGCRSIFARKGRYGGTYASVQLALHFANWMSPKFYLNTLDAYIDNQKRLYGPDAARKRFARELAAEDYELVRQAARKALPPKSDVLVKRRTMASEMDMINIAVFQITAREWRKKVMPTNPKDNMRNHATQEELKIIAKLELLNAKYIDHTGDPKVRLELLCQDARALLKHYFKDKQAMLEYRDMRTRRGW
jgi:hypothetical protein